jgi:hypothetical protein
MLACVAATNGHPLNAFVYGQMMLLADLALVMQIRIGEHGWNTIMQSRNDKASGFLACRTPKAMRSMLMNGVCTPHIDPDLLHELVKQW